MSTIRVDNFGPSAGGTTYSARGVAKAWTKWTASSAAPVIDNSLNTSSLTDIGTGLTQTNYTNAFSAAADYAVSLAGSAAYVGASGAALGLITGDRNGTFGAYTASATRSGYYNSGYQDPIDASIIAHGDLA